MINVINIFKRLRMYYKNPRLYLLQSIMMTTFNDSDWTDETNEKENEKENELEEEETSTFQITSFLGMHWQL